MVFRNNHLWRVSIPLPNIDGEGNLSVLVYKWKTYGDKTGEQLINEYVGNKVIELESKKDELMWNWLKI